MSRSTLPICCDFRLQRAGSPSGERIPCVSPGGTPEHTRNLVDSQRGTRAVGVDRRTSSMSATFGTRRCLPSPAPSILGARRAHPRGQLHRGRPQRDGVPAVVGVELDPRHALSVVDGVNVGVALDGEERARESRTYALAKDVSLPLGRRPASIVEMRLVGPPAVEKLGDTSERRALPTRWAHRDESDTSAARSQNLDEPPAVELVLVAPRARTDWLAYPDAALGVLAWTLPKKRLVISFGASRARSRRRS